MKKVLILSLAYIPHVGGAEVAIREITSRVSDIDFDMVTLRLDPKDLPTEKIGRIRVFRIGSGSRSRFSKFLFQFRAALKALQLHKDNSYDGIWAMMAHTSGVPAAFIKMRHPSLPLLLTLQEGDPLEYIEKTMRPLWPFFKRAFSSADILHSISTFLESWGRRMGFKGRSYIIPNGVDSWWFSQRHDGWNRKRFWEAQNRSSNCRIIDTGSILITTSRLVKKNGIDTVIRALPLLDQSVQFVVIGTGPELESLKRLAKELGVNQRVHFLGHLSNGRQIGDNVATSMTYYLWASDVFVRPSRSEGMGNSFIEAMAAKLPVIATQEGGIADFLFDAKRDPDKPTTGWAVDKDSPAQIAEAVKDIMSSPEKVSKVIETAHAMVVKKYDWELIANEMRSKVFGTLFKAIY